MDQDHEVAELANDAAIANAQVKWLEAEVERLQELLRGVGANRYWEGRWREDKAEIERLREQLRLCQIDNNLAEAELAVERERCARLLKALPQDHTWWDIASVLEKIEKGEAMIAARYWEQAEGETVRENPAVTAAVAAEHERADKAVAEGARRATITFERNIWYAKDEPLYDLFWITVNGLAHPICLKQDDQSPAAKYLRSVMATITPDIKKPPGR